MQGTLEAQEDQSSQDRGAGGRGEPEAATTLYLGWQSFNILATGSHHPVSPGDPQRGSNCYLDMDPASTEAGSAMLCSCLSSLTQAWDSGKKVGGRTLGCSSGQPLWPQFSDL